MIIFHSFILTGLLLLWTLQPCQPSNLLSTRQRFPDNYSPKVFQTTSNSVDRHSLTATGRRNSRAKRDQGSSKNAANQTVVRAAEYLLKQKNSDYGWGSFTPRALIALAFAERVFKIPEQEKTLMKKQLDVQILLNLKRSKGKQLNLTDLSLYINALYSNCENPRNFKGTDLVDLLRSETDTAMKADFNLPLVLMTLCIANGQSYVNTTKLITMYDDMRNDRIGFKALTIIAMIACRSRSSSLDGFKMEKRMIMFQKELRSQINHADLYTKALAIQALIAMGIPVPDDVWIRQFDDGSFGDLLATYYAIPILLNTSLANLKCNEPDYDDVSLGASLSNYDGPKKNVTYSLWISKDGDIDSHTMYLTVERNKTLFDIMMLAQSKDPTFRFTYDKTRQGNIVVYSLAGLPNDAETGMTWNLYHGKGHLDFKSDIQEERRGIKTLFPEDGSHYIFWRERKFR